MTKAPKSLPLCLPRNAAARPAPGRGACVNMPRRGGGVATYEKQLKTKSTAVTCGGLHGPKVSARKGSAWGLSVWGDQPVPSDSNRG